jgi:plastocyanin
LRTKGISEASVAFVVLILTVAVVTAFYVDNTQGRSDQISSLQSEIQNLTKQSSTGSNMGLPVMNQPPTVRTVRETWYLSPSSHQDRFDPSFIVVNQGDTVRLTLIDNDTVAHNFVIGPPYNIVVNATVPGLVNDLTHQRFKTNATNNSPGVVIKGTPGNVSAAYSFVAAYAGIFEFVCTYHVEVGMFGYLVVLPNAGYTPGVTTQTSSESTTIAGTISQVTIVQGAGANVTIKGFTPNTITVVIGVNNTVLWTNEDSAPHTVTAKDGSFGSSFLAQGGTFMWTFTTPGQYEYYCQIHPWMTGTVIVKA